jgi:hypothetical protein
MQLIARKVMLRLVLASGRNFESAYSSILGIQHHPGELKIF